MKPVKETNGGMATVSPFVSGEAKDKIEGGATAPTQHAAQALQYDVLWTLFEFWEASATFVVLSSSAAALMSAKSC